jgi:hypothetical protein
MKKLLAIRLPVLPAATNPADYGHRGFGKALDSMQEVACVKPDTPLSVHVAFP